MNTEILNDVPVNEQVFEICETNLATIVAINEVGSVSIIQDLPFIDSHGVQDVCIAIQPLHLRKLIAALSECADYFGV